MLDENPETAPPLEYNSAQLSHLASSVEKWGHPEQIGPYHILEPLGEGGMGTVYRAEQRTPLQRVVAVKVIKVGMDTREVVARFEAERQALALMEHPNVARAIDAGTTDDGRPYFVMEYVPGESITDYADKHRLTVRERLALFTQACDAVQHAHQKAIIHRDLKPSNILVTQHDGKPQVKVIDFGVAKALDHRLTDKTVFTEMGRFIGTLEYMSPEQADAGGTNVDTRTDVYSLGVVLYLLLTGAAPFDEHKLRSCAYYEIERIIREVDPPRPSSRLANLGKTSHDIAQLRRTQPAILQQQLKRELEWIPLKAMRKEPAQRYASPKEFSEDIANYLADRPLRAGPELRTYRARKFLRRNKGPVAASAAMVLILVAGIVTTTMQSVRARRAESLARTSEAQAKLERDNATAIGEFLTDDVLANATPESIPDAKVRDQIVKAMIMPAADRVGETFKDRPIIEARTRDAIRDVLIKIGRAEMALPHAQRSLAIYQHELGSDHPMTLIAGSNLARVLEEMGQFAEAEPIVKDVLDRRRTRLGDENAATLVSMNNYAKVVYSLGRFNEALALYKRALDLRRRAFGNDDRDTLASVNNYATALRALDRAAEAEPLFKEALDSSRRMLGADHPSTITAINNYAHVLKSLGRNAEAAPLFKEALDRRARVLGEDHPDTLTSMCQYALVLQAQGQIAEADRLVKESVDRSTRAMGKDHYLSITLLNNYAGFLYETHRETEAEPVFKDALERRRRLMGVDHVDTLASENNYAAVLYELGRAADAEPLSRHALVSATANPSLGVKHRYTQRFAATLARILARLNRPTEAAAVRKDYGLPEPTTQPATQPTSAPTTRTS